jgi:hypothetical protein
VRILVTGSREWTDRAAIEKALIRLARLIDAERPSGNYFAYIQREPLTAQVTVVHGSYRGADTLADAVASELGWTVEAHPADWVLYGDDAGPIRNTEMVEAGADVCVAFPGPKSKGTWDCIRKAAAAGIPVWIEPPRVTP